MDLIQIDENGLHLVFEKTEDFGCKLLHFSALPFDERSLLRTHDRGQAALRLNTERYNLLEIMISGKTDRASATVKKIHFHKPRRPHEARLFCGQAQ